MRPTLLLASLLAAGCAHTEIAVNSRSHEVTSGASVRVGAAGAVAAALVAGAVIAATVNDLREPQQPPHYRSFSDWLRGEPAPEMDPSRTVSEQDCSKPIAGGGNLRCR